MQEFPKLKFVLPLYLAMMASVNLNAQSDSLTFFNGNYIVGEVKNMDRGVLTVETDYSDKDFTVEWEKIKEIYTATYFLITLSDGRRYNGYVNTTGPGKITITTSDGQSVNVIQDDIVWLEDVDKGFWSQLYASIDIGFDITKANNLRQVSTQAKVGYMAARWNLDGTYNSLFSKQDETDDTKRNDGGVGFKYFLPHDWYPLINVNFLSNTEQKLKLRSTAMAGAGNYIIHTNRTYWGFAAGTNFKDEVYSVDTIARKESWEGFFGSELNIFDIGDLNLFTKMYVYPSFTEAGRWRTDFNFDAKYEMPFDDDFYIKFSVTVNFDNQPVEGAGKTDYLLHSGFGWSW
jgi:hypothetical protein